MSKYSLANDYRAKISVRSPRHLTMPNSATKPIEDASGGRWYIGMLIAMPLFVFVTSAPRTTSPTLMDIIKHTLSVSRESLSLNYVMVLPAALGMSFLLVSSIIMSRYDRFYVHFACATAIFLSLSMFLSALVNRVWQLFITYSVPGIVGDILQFAVIACLLADYFPITHRLHVMATSLWVVGRAVSTAAMNPLLALVYNHIGMQNSFYALGAFTLIMGLPFSLLMKAHDQGKAVSSTSSTVLKRRQSSDDNDKAVQSQMSTSSTDITLMRRFMDLWTCTDRLTKAIIVLWAIVNFLGTITQASYQINIVTYMNNSLDLSLQDSANVMLTYSVVYVVATFVCALLGDFIRGYLVYVLVLGFAAALLAACVYAFADLTRNFVVAHLLAGVFGASDSVSLALSYAAAIEVCKIDMHTAIAVTQFPSGFGALMSPFVGGFLQSDVRMFYAIIASDGVQVIIFVLIAVLTLPYFDKRHKQYEEIDT